MENSLAKMKMEKLAFLRYRKHYINSIQWKQSLATGNLKANFWLKDKAKYEVFTSNICWMTIKQTQTHPLQILKDPFIIPGCAVNLAE